MSISHIRGSALSGLSHINGIAKSGLSHFNGQALPSAGGIALVTSLAAVPADPSTANTSSAIDTTGASLLVWAFSRYTLGSAPSLSDSKGNTFVGLTEVTSPNDFGLRLYYVKNPTVGSGHTFSWTGNDVYSMFAVLAFSGTDTAANADQQSGTNGSSPLAPGSITPSTDNSLVVAAFAGSHTSGSVDSGFTEVIDLGSVTVAFRVQGAAAAVNPTCTVAGTGTNLKAVAASFKAA